MGGRLLNQIGIQTERKTTRELYEIFNKIKINFPYELKVIDFYRNKKTHGDLDILLKTNDNKLNIINIIKDKINPSGIVTNGTTISFDFDMFQIDIIIIKPDKWETSDIFYSYDPSGNLMGKISKGFGLHYGTDGLFYKLNNNKKNKYILSSNNEQIFNFLGYDFNEFKNGFDTLENIMDYIIDGKFFDKLLFDPMNLTSMDRKRSLKRPTFNRFLGYIKNKKSNYKFNPKETYIDYINDYFPGFKEKIINSNKIREEQIKVGKKYRFVIKKIFNRYDNGVDIGLIIRDFKLSHNDFNNYILNNSILKIENDFKNFLDKFLK
jgi:hypothetical protein